MLEYQQLLADLRHSEGLRLEQYTCPAGYLTIGYGRNQETHHETDILSCTLDQAEQWLEEDANEAIDDAISLVGEQCWNYLPPSVQRGFADMSYNLGKSRLRKFRKMIAALKEHNYEEAANQAYDSKWRKQVGRRADKIIQLFRTA